MLTQEKARKFPLTVLLPPETDVRLEEIARQLGMTKSGVVRALVMDGMTGQKTFQLPVSREVSAQ